MSQYSAKTKEAFFRALDAPCELQDAGVVFTGRAGGQRGQGPFIELTLSLREGLVVDAVFNTFGCPAFVACSSEICDLARGKSLEELRHIDQAAVATCVGVLPRAKKRALSIAVQALQEIISQIELSVIPEKEPS